MWRKEGGGGRLHDVETRLMVGPLCKRTMGPDEKSVAPDPIYAHLVASSTSKIPSSPIPLLSNVKDPKLSIIPFFIVSSIIKLAYRTWFARFIEW